MMEVDLHSPSFTALRSFPTSSKRARSPESLLEPPAKRPSLAIDRSRLEGNFGYHMGTSSSGDATPQSPKSSSSRFPSEDWVHQADGLTIDSPVIPGSGLAEDQDDDMNMDPDHSILEDRTQRPHHRPPPQSMSYTQTTRYHRQHQEHTAISTTSPPTPSNHLTDVLPPAAAVSPSPTSYSDAHAHMTRTSTPAAPPSGDSTAMLLSSPTTSFAVANVTSPRRQRFTMGPRSDCIKCQLGVKGHSVHY
ncbi:hypothetical protein LshimejAT787_0209750 [Lyophyllum shimeji]|uniref:Uncharacterized protein n=1 Tax=Lyophyllum shimeji TaxID=47721 RepID=A0A9P3ULA2_LYOSH|nr:hypothetical protein LshimejAT787_0209750 [Lyophyllum shimeji]